MSLTGGKRASLVAAAVLALSSTVAIVGAEERERTPGKLLVAAPRVDLALLRRCLTTFVPSLIDPQGRLLAPAVPPADVVCAEHFRHPLQALARVSGPVPLFEALDDPGGMRYVVGEGSAIASEGSSTPSSSTGLYLASRRTMTAEERRADAPPPLDLVQPPKVNPELARAAAESPGADVDVVMTLRDPSPGLMPAVERLIAQGTIRTRTDYEAAQDQVRRAQSALVARTVGEAADAVIGLGGRVRYRCQNLPCLLIRVPAATLDRLAAQPHVVELDVERTAIEAGMTGTEVRTGTQLRQFTDPQFHYDGNGINETNENDNVVGAVVECCNGGYADHEGFREFPNYFYRYASSPGASGKWWCLVFFDASGCLTVNGTNSATSIAQYPVLSNHAEGAAGLFFGDLQDAQIPTIPAAEREGGSGYAPEARSHLYAFTTSTAAVVAFDHIAGLTSGQRSPDLISNSWGYIEGAECAGTHSSALAANRLYRDGIAVFAAAHNRGGSSSQCKVTAPGSALGSFTVGAHMLLTAEQIATADANTVRTAPIYSGTNASSWGGNAAEGQNRSIVSLTGPGTRTDKFNTSGGLTDTGIICCTSHATPTVAGHAADFIDFYRATYSNFIDNPGSLYASMLLMGDRQGTFGTLASSPDHRWGAGRVRMRMFNSAGMDAPWHWFNGWTCVADGDVVDFPLAEGATLSSDIDAVKAAAYWFDTRHDGSDLSGATGSVANVNMRLIDGAGSTIVTDPDGFDNKSRLFAEGVGGKKVTLRLTGQSVAGHSDPVCGSNAIRVFFTHFAEDSDRNAPTFDAGTGAGIFPEGA